MYQHAVRVLKEELGGFAFQAQVQTHLFRSWGSFGQGKTGMQGVDKETSRPWKKSYRVGEHCFARTREVLCGGVNEAGRMRHKQITEKNS